MRFTQLGGSLLVACGLAIAAFASDNAQAQSFPNRQITIIVGVAPGGGTDATARLLAQQLAKDLGQSVVVQNKPGAGSQLGDETVVKSDPDGYTILVTSDDVTAMPASRLHLPFDVSKDLTPIAMVGVDPNVLVVSNSLPVKTTKDLIELAKTEPGKLSFGSSGVGSMSHLDVASFAAAAGIDLQHVPFKGSREAAVAIAQGEVDLGITSITSAKSLVDAGKVKIIAVSSPDRTPLMPSMPTINESGLPGFSFMDWVGVFGPANLPPDILAKLNSAINAALTSPEMTSGLSKLGMQAQPTSPEQFKAFFLNDLQEKVKLVKTAGLKPQ